MTDEDMKSPLDASDAATTQERPGDPSLSHVPPEGENVMDNTSRELSEIPLGAIQSEGSQGEESPNHMPSARTEMGSNGDSIKTPKLTEAGDDRGSSSIVTSLKSDAELLEALIAKAISTPRPVRSRKHHFHPPAQKFTPRSSPRAKASSLSMSFLEKDSLEGRPAPTEATGNPNEVTTIRPGSVHTIGTGTG